MSRTSRLACILALGAWLLAVPVWCDATPTPAAADATDLRVTMEQIMADTDWLGGEPQKPYWSADGKTVFFERDPADEADDDERLWQLRVDSATQDGRAPEMSEVPLAELGAVEPDGGDWSADRTRKVYAQNGDIFLLDPARAGGPRQLTRTAGQESRPLFLTGGGRVAFLQGDTWLVRDLASGLEWQPAEIVADEDPLDKEPADDFLAEQQRRLFDKVRDDEATRERRQARERERRSADPASVPPPFYLGKGKEILASSLSPAGDAILLLTAPEGRDEGVAAKMPNYIGDDGYVEIREVRSKVGVGGDYTHSLTLLDLAKHEIHPIDLSSLPGIAEDPLADLKAAQEAARATKEDEEDEATKAQEDEATVVSDDKDQDEGEKGEGEDGGAESDDETEPRDVRVYDMKWSPDGKLAAAVMNATDNKDRWLILVSRDDPRPRVAHRLTMEGWINWDFNDFGWLPDGRLWYLSEETGYSHLYVYDPASTQTTALTAGEFVVSSPQPDPAGKVFYVVASPDRPTSFDVYRVASKGGGRLERVTRMGGETEFRLSPGGDRLLLRNSQLTEPPELFLHGVEPGAKPVQLTHTTSAAFEALPWVRPEIVQVPSSHQDRPVWGRYYPPQNPALLQGADGKVPAVIFIHGAGYLQNAHEGWSGYFREFMFHTFLAQRGYAVLDLDYRGSKGYGADWRQAIYRHMGQPELEDLLDGRAWLAAQRGVDPNRVGIYGGSYGGFMVMMALFKAPGEFASGAALRPVTDWAHYNHGYTSNILNTPQVDPEAYARSSPIEFAAGLEDPLLICAPMMDDNVHFQDVVRLVQRLIELDKISFEVALFPVEPHGFRRPSSWLNEYRRIYRLFDETLRP